MHTTYTKEGGGELKKYKNKLHKGSSASLLAKYLGRFCNFVCVLQVSVQAKSVVLFGEQKKKKKISLSLFCPQ